MRLRRPGAYWFCVRARRHAAGWNLISDLVAHLSMFALCGVRRSSESWSGIAAANKEPPCSRPKEEPPSRNVPLVAAVASSGRHGFRKEVCRAITLVKGFGVEGDAHGGATVQHLYEKAKDPCRPNLRQVPLLEEELILELNALGFSVAAGDLGENITTRHVHLAGLRVGVVLQLDPARAFRSRGFVHPAWRSTAHSPACGALWPSRAMARR